MKSDESTVADFLADHSMRAERFSKAERRRSKTPDFRVYEDDDFKFFCEVKSLVAEDWLKEHEVVTPHGTFAEAVRKDPTFNRLSAKIHEAVGQFDAVNPAHAWPNVLAFVNHDSFHDIGDVRDVVSGCFVDIDGRWHPIYKKHSEGRIKEEKWRIDFYLWRQPEGKWQFGHTGPHAKYADLLFDCFGLEPPETPQQ